MLKMARYFRYFFVTSVLLGLLSLVLLTNAQSNAQTTQLVFVNHIQLDAPEQDVMWMDEDGALWRVAPEAPLSTLNQPLYTSTTGAEHDPFRLSDAPLGAFEAGEALGFTLAQWLAAEGSGTYTVDGDMATLELTFDNLIADGVYTMWCSQIHLPDDFLIENYPCGAANGSENTFVADAEGQASFSLNLPPVPFTTAEMLSVFAVNYHSDGNTYGADPGNFGFNAHVQILAVAPPAETE